MLTHQQMYYLQTMGILPWVMRRVESPVLITVVMKQRIHDARQKKLVDAMFRSIGVSEKMLDMLYDSQADNLNQYIHKTKPRVIIALGCKVDVCDETPVVDMYHPADLLQNPCHKHEVYHALGRVAACLMTELGKVTPA